MEALADANCAQSNGLSFDFSFGFFFYPDGEEMCFRRFFRTIEASVCVRSGEPRDRLPASLLVRQLMATLEMRDFLKSQNDHRCVSPARLPPSTRPRWN